MRLLELIKLAVAAPSGAEHKRRRADRFYATRGMYGGGAKKASSTYADLGNMPNASPIHRNIFNAIVHRGVSTMSERPSYGHELLRSLNSITPAAALPARKNDPLSFGSFFNAPSAFADAAEQRYAAAPWYSKLFGNLRAGVAGTSPGVGIVEGFLPSTGGLSALQRIGAPVAQAASIHMMRNRARAQDVANFNRLMGRGMVDMARRMYPELAP